jgi:pimeloyl-ACP methyl ester carboxylesterase
MLLIGCGSQAVATTTPAPSPTALPSPTPAPSPTPPGEAALSRGLRVDIGGRSLFIRCVGPVERGPTVLFESGLAGAHDSWDAVQQQSGQFVRSCSYDRAGMGQSDPAAAPRDGAAAVSDLRALLAAAGVAGPYVLVGHSFGALITRITADQLSDQVVGVVLVDPVHEDWWEKALAALPPPADGDSERLRSFRQFLTVDVGNPARNQEGFDIPALAAQARATGNLGRRPLVVLSAGIFDVVAPGLPPNIEARLKELFQHELPQKLTALSTDSTQIAVPDSGHNIPRQRPDIVALAIQAVLSAVSPKS